MHNPLVPETLEGWSLLHLMYRVGWDSVRRLGDDEIFLMNWAASDSMDGRYFGPLAINSIIGRATSSV